MTHPTLLLALSQKLPSSQFVFLWQAPENPDFRHGRIRVTEHEEISSLFPTRSSKMDRIGGPWWVHGGGLHTSGLYLNGDSCGSVFQISVIEIWFVIDEVPLVISKNVLYCNFTKCSMN
tara:strand:- start:133 stop:489 length:357 start_codon:yes stop_codon:yes gene_type:complete